MTTFITAHRSRPLLALVALACALISANVSAAPAAEGGRSVTVSYGDLNISSPAGATVLYGRIKRAAGLVCGTGPNPAEMGRHLIWRACVDGAVADAVATVGSPRLTALHAKTTGSKTLTAALSRDSTAK
jgi:UrcA family protein